MPLDAELGPSSSTRGAVNILDFKSLLPSLLLVSAVSAQLSGSVGPTSSLASKQSTICNVLDYGGSVGFSDVGPTIASACSVRVAFVSSDLGEEPCYQNCVLKSCGSTLYVLEGTLCIVGT